MVFTDPENNRFYFLSDRARAVHGELPKNLKDVFQAAMRPLAMGTTARNPFVYERHDPDADPYRTLNVYWQELHIRFRNVPDDPRYEITDIEITPELHQPGMFFP